MISVQHDDFSVAEEYQWLNDNASDGAVVTFVGKVRDMNLGDNVTGLTLEHYPGMTEKSLEEICNDAKARWPLGKVRVIHRVGALNLGDQIVFVGVSSAHRKAAFDAWFIASPSPRANEARTGRTATPKATAARYESLRPSV